MTSLNLADNNIGKLVMSEGWQYDEDADEYWKEVEGEELVEKQLPAGEQLAIEGPVGAIAIVNAIKDMGALSKLVMRQNNIHGAEAGKAFADMLARNTVLKELDLSSQKVGDFGAENALDVAFAKEFAAGISDNGALIKLGISNNDIGAEQKGGLQRICVAGGIELAI
jgi:hypothetical protein